MIKLKKAITSVLLSGLLLACLTSKAQSVKIGFTKLDYILAQTPEAKEVAKQLGTQQAQAENEIKRMQKELEDKYAAYQKGAAQMSDVIRKDRESELQSLQTRIQEFGRTAEASIQDKYKQAITPILTKVQQTIDAVAKENGYTHVLNIGVGSTSNILYASEENNITDLVFKKLGITPGQNQEIPAKTSAATAPVKKAAVPKKK